MGFDKERFAELLSLAKGNRSINNYGRISGVDPGYISRLLRQQINKPPSALIINKLSSKAQNEINNIQLMHAAGYVEDELINNEYTVLQSFPHDFQEYIKNSKDINKVFEQSCEKYLLDFTNEQGGISEESKRYLLDAIEINNIDVDINIADIDTLNGWIDIIMNSPFSFKVRIAFLIYERTKTPSENSNTNELKSKRNNPSAKDEKDIAKRLDQIRKDIEHSDGLAFDGDPLSDEAKESVMEAMEFIVRQTKKINEKYTPKKYRKE